MVSTVKGSRCVCISSTGCEVSWGKYLVFLDKPVCIVAVTTYVWHDQFCYVFSASDLSNMDWQQETLLVLRSTLAPDLFQVEVPSLPLARWVTLLWTKWLHVQYMTGWREEGQRNVSGWPTWACADARLKTNEPKKVTSDHPLLPVPLWETGGVEQKLLPTDYRGALSCEKKDLGFQTFHFEVHIRFIPQAPTSHVWVTLITGLRSCEPVAVISQSSEVVAL